MPRERKPREHHAHRVDNTVVADDSPYRPYTLWFKTLPTGDTAQVYLGPHSNRCDVISHWNGRVWRAETRATLAEAERLAWTWWDELPRLISVGPDDLAAVALPTA